MLIEEMLVIDATTIYPRYTKGGGLYSLDIIDGATIKPLIGEDGRAPEPPDPAYQQILKGVAYFCPSLSVRRVDPVGKLFDKRFIRKNIVLRMLFALLAHEVVLKHANRCRPARPIRRRAAALAQSYPCRRRGAGALGASDLRNADRRGAEAR
jgi:hypothetical protein